MSGKIGNLKVTDFFLKKGDYAHAHIHHLSDMEISKRFQKKFSLSLEI